MAGVLIFVPISLRQQGIVVILALLSVRTRILHHKDLAPSTIFLALFVTFERTPTNCLQYSWGFFR
ncbi:hypothetical protein NIES4072_21660 [Nostoc commune NIES-4072]|uniref:Uncharacterized protein n=1 Tax=Nostoc commune NIES-4072 TaxID=2005467 RepID=A0A2R5FRR4_NOSCO|nr:hypothetical protein NIES4070_05140 [Nostoc commune HK-02]GBG18501.1 hypothetical protein NIES4072_21660 [Nostoc commune NIES-4072]